MPKNVKILIAAFLELAIMVASILLIVDLYHQQYSTLSDINKNIKADGIRLNIKETELLMLLGDEHKEHPYVSGHQDVFEKLDLTAIIDAETQMVKAIITKNEAHSLYGIKAGVACQTAGDVLLAKGFLLKDGAEYEYVKQDVQIKLLHNQEQQVEGFIVESL